MIRAEVHDDNHTHSVNFDATPWFESASDNDIAALAGEGFGFDYMADDVANSSKDPAVVEFFGRLNAAQSFFPQGIGFECSVEEDDAVQWVRENRPHLLSTIVDSLDTPTPPSVPSTP